MRGAAKGAPVRRRSPPANSVRVFGWSGKLRQTNYRSARRRPIEGIPASIEKPAAAVGAAGFQPRRYLMMTLRPEGAVSVPAAWLTPTITPPMFNSAERPNPVFGCTV